MILLDQTPPSSEEVLSQFYRRMPVEGMVQSSMMRGERFHRFDHFDDAWACPAITWSAGGAETYRFEGGRQINIRSTGALTLTAGARYDYAANGDGPFRSSMIVFPHWITDSAGRSPFGDYLNGDIRFSTRLFRPSAATERLMNSIADRCRRRFADRNWYAEKLALLYDLLIAAESEAGEAPEQVAAAKPTTRRELARRIDRAQQFILQNYGDADLDLQTIAKEACLSRFHLIRTFKAIAHMTPMQFLGAARVDAAMRLLRHTKMKISDIATAVGYRDRSSFFRSFQRRYQTAPSQVERPASATFHDVDATSPALRSAHPGA